jgi:diguanylate cyclase (GGDEF)-like protein
VTTDAPQQTLQNHTDSREAAVSVTALTAILQADSHDLQREILLSQRWVRYAAAAIAAMGAFYLDGQQSLGGREWLALIMVVAGYLAWVTLTGLHLERTREQPLPPWLAPGILVADIAMISGVVIMTANPYDYDRILMFGVLAVPLAAFYFSQGAAIWSLALTVFAFFAAVFFASAAARPPLAGVGFDALIFIFVSGVLLYIFDSFRLRMSRLRVFCKRVEAGDLAVPYDVAHERYRDELTLLARSVDGMRSRLIELIGTDPLTGCLNRRALETRLGREWRGTKRREGLLSLLALDLDNFKQVNDTLGHGVGDAVLHELALIMHRTARDTDAVARLGGDEFVIILPDTGWQGAMTLAERIRANVEEQNFGTADAPIRMTISVGVAHARGIDDVSAEDLMEQADRSLYRAKDAGRNRISA